MQVYVSSTFEDLKEYRGRAASVIRKLGCETNMMEDYVASDERPLAKCLRDVRECDIYVVLIAWRAGFCPDDGEKSITRLEYEEARSNEIPCLAFVMDARHKWNLRDKDPTAIQAFRDEVEDSLVVAHFTTPDRLASELATSLARKINDLNHIPPVPDLLPYRADRSSQNHGALSLVRTHLQSKVGRPALLFVHGETDQAHSPFVEQLQRIQLPKALKLDETKERVDLVRVPWPDACLPLADRKEALSRELAAQLVGDADASVEDLLGSVIGRHNPIVISTETYSSLWAKDELQLLDHWMRFWNDWPDLSSGQLLLVAHSVHYEHQHRGLIRGFFAARDLKKIAQSLAGFSFKQYPRISGKALPALGDVHVTHVLKWVGEELSEFCKRRNISHTRLAELMKARITEYFETSADRSTDGIPMEPLARDTRKLLTESLAEVFNAGGSRR